jgi:hypothetical protein
MLYSDYEQQSCRFLSGTGRSDRLQKKLETKMKKLALAAALSVAASTAFAGGMAQPIMEETPMVAAVTQTSSSNGGLLIPLLLLLVLAAAAANA